MIAQFNRFELQVPVSVAIDCSQGGKDATEDVDYALRCTPAGDAVDALDPEAIREELREYGAWDEDELADDEANRARLLWIASCNIHEELFQRLSDLGADHDDISYLFGNPRSY